MTSIDRERAAAYVGIRRGQLGMTQQELAKTAGVDVKTVNGMETGRSWPQAPTLAGIERALRLSPGSLLTIAKGGRPSQLDDAGPIRPDARPSPETLLELIRDLEYLTDDDIARLEQQWESAKQHILETAQQINEVRASGRRRRKGA